MLRERSRFRSGDRLRHANLNSPRLSNGSRGFFIVGPLTLSVFADDPQNLWRLAVPILPDQTLHAGGPRRCVAYLRHPGRGGHETGGKRTAPSVPKRADRIRVGDADGGASAGSLLSIKARTVGSLAGFLLGV